MHGDTIVLAEFANDGEGGIMVVVCVSIAVCRKTYMIELERQRIVGRSPHVGFLVFVQFECLSRLQLNFVAPMFRTDCATNVDGV